MSSPLPAGTEEAHDFADARWFPADLNVADCRYGFIKLDEHALVRSSFLDTRVDASLGAAKRVLASQIPPVLPKANAGWLFHTSFCGSTLLARALHLHPYVACLREPLVLRRLSDARHSGWLFGGLIDPTLRLLVRPWQSGGSIVLKPTHAALNIAVDLMAALPASRAIVLTSSLDDFLVSNLKKAPESQAKIPILAERALRAGTLRLPAAALQPPDLLAAAALQWAAQRELALDIVESVGSDRVRLLGTDYLLADLPGVTAQVARWLHLEIPSAELRQHCNAVCVRNAKATDSPYGPQQRAREVAMVTDLFNVPLTRARVWAQKYLLPFMRSRAVHDPEPWESS